MNNSSIFVDGFVLWLKCVTFPTNSQSLPIFATFGIFWIISKNKDTYDNSIQQTHTEKKRNRSNRSEENELELRGPPSSVWQINFQD